MAVKLAQPPQFLWLFVALALGCGDKKAQSEGDTPGPAKARDLGASSAKEPEEKTPVETDSELAKIVATCSWVVGEAEVRRVGQTYWERVSMGATFREGDWVRTKKGATARLRFESGGSIDLDPETVVIVETQSDAAGEQEVVVAVNAGSVTGAVGGDRDGSRQSLAIRTTGEVSRISSAGDDASKFRLTRTENSTEVTTRSGTVVVQGAEGETHEIAASRGASVRRGRVGRTYAQIGLPKSISPGIDARFHCEEDTSIELTWKRVRRARSYQVQVARDLGFQHLIDSEGTRARNYRFSPTEMGVYAWRVAARDRRGVLGEYGFARRLYCQQSPVVDLLLSPRDGAKFAMVGTESPTVVFSWQSAGAVRKYRLVVARGSTLDKPMIETDVTGQKHVTSELKKGIYSWGVFTEDNTAIFASPRRFRVGAQPRPEANAKGIWEN